MTREQFEILLINTFTIVANPSEPAVDKEMAIDFLSRSVAELLNERDRLIAELKVAREKAWKYDELCK